MAYEIPAEKFIKLAKDLGGNDGFRKTSYCKNNEMIHLWTIPKSDYTLELHHILSKNTILILLCYPENEEFLEKTCPVGELHISDSKFVFNQYEELTVPQSSIDFIIEKIQENLIPDELKENVCPLEI